MKIGSMVIHCHEWVEFLLNTLRIDRWSWGRLYPWRARRGSDFIVLEDPYGNLFCVIQVQEAGVDLI